ncbi:hypothetical protein [Arthrobacter sp. 2MCAF14]
MSGQEVVSSGPYALGDAPTSFAAASEVDYGNPLTVAGRPE